MDFDEKAYQQLLLKPICGSITTTFLFAILLEKVSFPIKDVLQT